MFTLTDNAKKELDAFFTDKEKSPVRVFMTSGGCSGPHLALALDETRGNDQTFDAQGFQFCIDKDLFTQVQGVTIDAGYMGFIVESVVPLEGGEGGCSSCAGCGG
ncbi:MAG: IscA/HesB family protein [Desulfovibrionaceae bacterium]|nr:IscA/HesB family protein [Desulfovibrionaceae bacterium]